MAEVGDYHVEQFDTAVGPFIEIYDETVEDERNPVVVLSADNAEDMAEAVLAEIGGSDSEVTDQ